MKKIFKITDDLSLRLLQTDDSKDIYDVTDTQQEP